MTVIVPESSGKQETCPVCGTPDAKFWKPRTLDRQLSSDHLLVTDSTYGATLTLYKCKSCGFIFASGEEMAILPELYAGLDDPEYEKTQDVRALQMRWLLKKITKQKPDAKTLVDIGAGTGLLVKQAKQLGLDAVGVEPSRAFVEAGTRSGDIKLYCGIFPHPELAGKKFDIITMIDVIEHLADPVGLVRDCANALNPNGILVVVTPNVKSFVARVMGRKWWHFRLAHVGYFSLASLDTCLKRGGLERKRWFTAKWFFHVSYLADRLGKYLPLKTFNRVAQKTPGIAWLYRREVPLNLRDSIVVIASPDSRSSQNGR